MISKPSNPVVHKRSVFFCFYCHWLLSQQEAVNADLKSILNPNFSAASAPTLSQCDAANTSALLLGLWPTNPFTPWKHKQIDALRREPDNPSFHLHSRLSSITGILSPVSSLVTRRTNRKQRLWPLAIFINMSNKPWPLPSQGHWSRSHPGQHTTTKGQMTKVWLRSTA